MPKKTFDNLTYDKQKMINDAAIVEFSRVDFNEASINKIIQNAGISRGSFYMYFEDKEDLYLHLLKTHQQKLNLKFQKIIKENNGDIINSYLSLFSFVIKHFTRGQEKLFYHNMILNIGAKHDSFFCKKDNNDPIYIQSLDLFNYSNLRVTSDEISEVLDILNIMLIHSIIKVLKHREDENVVYEQLQRQLHILKSGLYMKEEENND